MEPGPLPSISPHTYQSWLECPRQAWFDLHEPSSLPSRKSSWTQLFDAAVKTLFPPLLADLRGKSAEERIQDTLRFIGNRRGTLLGSLFRRGPFSAEPDLIILGDGGFTAAEVKTSSKLKKKYSLEFAFISEVIRANGIFPSGFLLYHLNKHYVETCGGNYRDLFIEADMTRRVYADDAAKDFPLLEELLLQDRIPSLCLHCQNPAFNGQASCRYRKRCFPDPRPYPVSSLHQSKKLAEELAERNIFTIADIPDTEELTDKQKIQVKAVKSGTPHIDTAALKEFCTKLSFPLSFLDFESYSTALPLYSGLTPWEHVPFQFSLHILSSPASAASHASFLADEKADPREPFLAALKKALPDSGSVIVYNRRFEAGILSRLGTLFADYADWTQAVVSRIRDLLVPFQNFYYYHPQQKGRFSLKKVLPLLTDLSYSDLPVANGEDANSLYAELIFAAKEGTGEEEGRLKLRAALEEYCGLDTEGMVAILRRFFEITR